MLIEMVGLVYYDVCKCCWTEGEAEVCEPHGEELAGGDWEEAGLRDARDSAGVARRLPSYSPTPPHNIQQQAPQDHLQA